MRELAPFASHSSKVSDGLFRTLFEEAAAPAVIVDLEGTLLEANRAARDARGIDYGRLVARADLRAIRAEAVDRGRAGGEVQVAGDAGEALVAVEGVRHGEVVLMTMRDRTAELAIERELGVLRRSESIGFLTATVVHDFNNLLTPILGQSELLSREPDISPRAAAMAAEIRAAAASAAGLVRRVLAFARREPSRKKRTSVNSVVAEARGLVELVAGDRILLDMQLAEDAGDATLDRGELECVVLNLVANARDAMPRGGRVDVRTASVTLDAGSDGSDGPAAAGEYVVLAVTDTGSGMTREARERLFERFYTTKGARGTGLGLANAQRFATEHGGCIVVRSDPGSGTTVALYLPRASGGDEHDSTPISAEIPRGSESVLVVEDDARVRGVVYDVLVDRGYRVVACGSGEEAIACTEARSFDLVLSDVVMHGMDGRELVDRLRTMGRATRALFMSGHTDRAIEARGVSLDDNALLRKAFTPSELARRVREALDGPARASVTSMAHARTDDRARAAAGERDGA